jgi:hypothetical protein
VKQSIPFFGINRRGLLSTLAVLPAFSGTLLAGSAQAETVPPGDALPSWNDGLAKQAIIDFGVTPRTKQVRNSCRPRIE